MRFLIGFVAGIAFLLLIALVVIWTGAYNVAASSGHAGLVRWAFETTFHNSVKSRSDERLMTAEMMRRADLQAGFREFQEYCVHCHGAPGAKPHEWTTGMVPDPPDLSRAAREWTPDQIFWIVKHGVKMTGMPSFGDSESDETIRNITAFVKQLPEMSPEEYARLKQQSASGESGGDSHGSHAH